MEKEQDRQKETEHKIKMGDRGEQLSIIIAARNEEASIRFCLERLNRVFPAAEIIVVDGGTDATGEIVLSLQKDLFGLRYIKNENDRGKGHAIRVALAHCTRPLITQVDADLQFMPEEIPKMLQPILLGQADFVMGSRFSSDSVRLPGSTPLLRTFGNKLISSCASIAYRVPISDVMAGSKAWRKSVTDSFSLTSDTFSYELELIAKAVRKGWRVATVGITTDARQGGQSSIRMLEHGFEVLRDIARFRIQSSDRL